MHFFSAALWVCSRTSKGEAPFKYHNEMQPDCDFIHSCFVDPSVTYEECLEWRAADKAAE